MKVLLMLAFSVLMTGSAFADCTESSPGKCSEAECKSYGFTYVSSNNEDVRCVKPGSNEGVTNCTAADSSGITPKPTAGTAGAADAVNKDITR